jgi:4a-hydroxytetrahydrobiopterin dehydratase
MSLLSHTEIARRLETLAGWALEGNAIRKSFVFAGFPEAVAFVGRLVPEAEQADHHPDVAIHYKTVVLAYSTHSKGGVTEKDFEGARMADRAASAGRP